MTMVVCGRCVMIACHHQLDGDEVAKVQRKEFVKRAQQLLDSFDGVCVEIKAMRNGRTEV